MVWLVCFHAAGALPAPALAQPTGARAVEDRYNLISAFLYNFLLFTEWPGDDPAKPLVIGVLGGNPFGKAADAIAHKTVAGRTIEFRFFDTADAVVPTHVLFIPQSQDHLAPEMCRKFRGESVLTVGESERFTREGGIIRFYEHRASSGSESVLRVEINEATAEKAGIRFRSKLMRLAQLVRYPWPDTP